MLAFCCPSSSCPSLRKKIELKMSFDIFEFSCIDHVVCDFRAFGVWIDVSSEIKET